MSTEPSTEQSVDPELVETTRQQIRGLVSEIANLARSDAEEADFYAGFLDRVVAALAAVGGAVWVLNKAGTLELAHQINLRQTGLADSEEALAQHGRLLRRAMAAAEGVLVPPQSGSGDAEEGGNPTDCLLVLGPVAVDRQVQGLIEVFQRPGTPPNTQRGYLRFLLQMCDLAADYLKTRQLRHYTSRQALWGQLEQFTRAAHASLDPRLTAYTIANEARRLIECDRVSVAIRRGKQCQVEAVSGQDTIDKRSNTIALLNRLTTAVVRTGETVWYTGSTRDLPPQVEEALEQYVDETHTKMLAILPLKHELETPETAEERKDHQPAQPVGALVVEQIEDSRLTETSRHRIEVVREHSAIALANAVEHHSLFLMPLWKTLGKAKWVVTGRRLPKTIAALSAVVVLLLAAVLVPADFELEGRGTLQPVVRQDVFAMIDGVVTDVTVNQGDLVEKDQLLAVLRSHELDVSLAQVQGDRDRTLEDLTAKTSILLQDNRLPPEQRLQISGEVRELQRALESYNAQLQLLHEKQAQLEVRSPRAGQLLTWDVKNRLIHRPVQRGQILMTVADPSQEWELEVLMPEHRMGHIARAENEARQRGEPLLVRYILATDPGTTHQGRVIEVHRMAEVKGEEGNTVLVRVAIDKRDLDDLRPGATVIARIHCGTRSIGYVWLHDLFAFIRQRILFRLF